MARRHRRNHQYRDETFLPGVAAAADHACDQVLREDELLRALGRTLKTR